jgi:hypothetical protein
MPDRIRHGLCSFRRPASNQTASLGIEQLEVASHPFACVEEIYSYCVRTESEDSCDLGGFVTAAAEPEDFLLAGRQVGQFAQVGGLLCGRRFDWARSLYWASTSAGHGVLIGGVPLSTLGLAVRSHLGDENPSELLASGPQSYPDDPDWEPEVVSNF